MESVLFVLSLVFIILLLLAAKRKKHVSPRLHANIQRGILQQQVSFYQLLNDEEKARFEKAVEKFLQTVRITGVRTIVEDVDKVFIAAAANIPIFAFGDWEYRNLHEVLLYPDSFDEEYKIAGKGRDFSGVVGSGPLQNLMILSQQDLRQGFRQRTDKSNTAIHEFVHLIDKSDGSVDGLPEILQSHQYSIPWLKRMRKEIELIRSGNSDINYYGTTNEAEFFAVAAEYFFKQPNLMKQNHPELFQMLEQIFNPAVRSSAGNPER